MTKLICYVDKKKKGGWANIQMDNGDHCWVEATGRRILVKRSRAVIFGVKMYEKKGEPNVAKVAEAFSKQYPNTAPDEIRNPVLKSVVNTVLHCSSLAEVTRVLNAGRP